VRATIRGVANYSAHADHSELMKWIKERLPAHGALFLTHGDDEERAALRQAVIAEHGLGGDQVVLPQLDDAFELRAEGVAGIERPAQRRIDPAQMSSDWHNAYASFIIDLSQRLQEADDDATRLKLVTALQSELAAADVAQGHTEPGGE
jgi:metallo-beta-lactamase family protein